MSSIFFKCLNLRFESFVRQLSYFFFRLLFANKSAKVPLNIYKLKKVLILRYDRIGDMVATLPSIDYIKRLNPDIQIDVMCSKKNFDVIKFDSRINNVYISDLKPIKLLRDALKIRKNNYDLIISFVFFKTTLAGLISNLAGRSKAYKATILHKEREKIYSAFFNIQVPLESFIQSRNMLEILFKMVCYIFGKEYDKNNIRLKLCLDEKSIQMSNRFVSSLPKGKYIIINLSAGHKLRTWDPENYKKLLSLLVAEYKDLVFILISSPEDYPISLSVSSNFTDRVFSYNSSSILDVAGLISHCKLVITPDTSIVHIASVYSVPVVGLYSKRYSNVNHWGPFGVPNKIILTRQEESINEIFPEEVLYAFKSLYSEIEPEIQSQ